MKTAHNRLCRKPGFLEYFGIRHKINAGAGLARFSDFREQPILQLYRGLAALITVVIDLSVLADFDFKKFGKGIDNRGAYSVQTTACFLCVVVEFAAGVECGKDDPLGGNAKLMAVNGDSPAVIRHGNGSVRLKRDFYMAAVTGKMLVYRIIHNFIYQMVQAGCGYTSDIHARSAANRFQAFQSRNTVSIIGLSLFCHRTFL